MQGWFENRVPDGCGSPQQAECLPACLAEQHLLTSVTFGAFDSWDWLSQKSFRVPFAQTQPVLGNVLQSSRATMLQITDTEMRLCLNCMTNISYVFSGAGQLAIRGCDSRQNPVHTIPYLLTPLAQYGP